MSAPADCHEPRCHDSSESKGARSHRVTWAEVEQNFFVASRAGEFVGLVDATADGKYVAFDWRTTPLGVYLTLNEAKASLSSSSHPTDVARREREMRVPLVIATISGLVAGALMLTAGVLALQF